MRDSASWYGFLGLGGSRSLPRSGSPCDLDATSSGPRSLRKADSDRRRLDAPSVRRRVRGVDVAVAELEREPDDLRGLRGVLARRVAVRRGLQGAEAELRDRGPVVEGDLRNGLRRHASFLPS